MMERRDFMIRTTKVLGVPFFADSLATCESLFSRWLEATDPAWKHRARLVFTPNPEQLMLAHRNVSFFNLLQMSDCNLPDGIGVVWASRFLHPTVQRIKERISGREMFFFLMARAEQQKYRVLLIGGKKGVADLAMNRLQKQYPHAVFSSDGGAFDITHESREEHDRVLSHISTFRPDVVCIAYGAPHQEQWLLNNRAFLDRGGVRVAMVVGGTLDGVAGVVRQPSRLIASLGFEWLWRLIQQPWRWKRQLALLQFVHLISKEKKK
ncbi:MAG: WecB/TagA/CpsF family glycosyltransferase [Candidatus Pacebacteria bacterium]|nr:WecB/TagA/CpsF family glycosyltransferase [Candidatus Paceibacterota bacterium]